MPVSEYFATRFLRDTLTGEAGWSDLNAELQAACLAIADDDEAGQALSLIHI